ncbi:MAG: hypothetical protein HY066_14065 [Betaproteobacteria bacterium]|nr:hypothetical protein [Betaproteobacteria bacterium]
MMAESFIRKIQPDRDGLDFDGLREEGIRLVQETSGDIWTDYNLHDPGVTVLEALCYALTDLVYRTGFSAADYLASSDGSLDYKKLALYRPDEIFPCHPITDNDYRKLILSSVPNIDNVWVQRPTARPGELHGLCNIYVQLSEQVKNQDNKGVRKAYANLIEKTYAANRNLCEDLAGVEIVKRIPFSLRGTIEVDGKREPANILAEIYFECAQYLSPKVPIHSYAEMHKSGRSLEDLFTGVLTGHGYIDEAELHPWHGHFSIHDLIGRIARVDGVKNINRLVFVDADGVETDPINLGNEHSYLSVACLRFPPSDSEGEIRLYKSGKVYPVLQRDVEPEFYRLEYKQQALRQHKLWFDWVDALLPAATFRNTSEYYSLQNHFPNAYGLNSYGIPDSSPPERKAQAAQLKAYLLFFEQVLANFLQNVQEIPRLFSTDEQLRQSYFYQVLGDEAVPNIEAVYLEGVTRMDARLAGLLADIDNFGDRRNRVLDYLLGVYGEKFSQNSLRYFFPENMDPEQERIRNKLALLKNIVEISKSRAAAFDYRKPSSASQNTSGLQRKLKLLLGFAPDDTAPPPETSGGTGQVGEDLQIVEHILLRPGDQPAQEGHEVAEDFFSFRLSVIFPSASPRFASTEFHKLAEETVSLNCPAHIHPEVFWLDQEQWGRFNLLHQAWQTAKRTVGDQPAKTAETASLLIDFLLEIRVREN